MKSRRDFVKNVSAGAFSLALPLWSLQENVKKRTFADHWKFVGVAVEEPGYTIWGTSPIADDGGKIHLFVGRWPKQYGIEPGWRSHSEIAHYVGNSPEGPFEFSDVALKGTGQNTWDKYAPHNPAIHRVNRMEYDRILRWLLLPCLCVYGLFCNLLVVQGQARYETTFLSLQMNSKHELTALKNKLSGTGWISGSSPIFKMEATGKVRSRLHIQTIPDGEIELYLSVTNTTKDPVLVSPVFPVLSHLAPAGSTPDDLYYLFPRQGAWATNKDSVQLSELYSGQFPLQFIDFYDGNQGGGIYLISRDTTNAPKRFYLDKRNGKINAGIIRRPRLLAAGETWILPPVVLGAHSGDWHEAFFAYRTWLNGWHKSYTPTKQWFLDVYNFRQVFLHRIFGEDGAFDPATGKIDLIKKIDEDEKAFGGVDYVHIFDWGQTPGYGRTGDYDPWDYLGGIEKLQQQIQLLHKRNIKTGLYFEGYLVDKKSRIGKVKGLIWQALNSTGETYRRFGTGVYYMCPLAAGWKDYIGKTIAKSLAGIGADGAYLDEYGFGWQYGCYNPQHGHSITKSKIGGALQVPGEAGMMKQVKHLLPGDKVTYTEEMPTDVSTQYQDGSFSYAVAVARQEDRHNVARINLPRFALPGFKLFEILHVDNPVGNDTDGIKHVFFNGEGLWIEGPLNNPKWFPETVRALIRKTHAILIANEDAFRSEAPVPGVATLDSSIYANYFPASRKNVWTLYNISDKTYSGSVLRVAHKEGAVFYDAWNKKYIYPRTKKGYDIVSLTIAGKDAGCLVQIFSPK